MSATLKLNDAGVAVGGREAMVVSAAAVAMVDDDDDVDAAAGDDPPPKPLADPSCSAVVVEVAEGREVVRGKRRELECESEAAFNED